MSIIIFLCVLLICAYAGDLFIGHLICARKNRVSKKL